MKCNDELEKLDLESEAVVAMLKKAVCVAPPSDFTSQVLRSLPEKSQNIIYEWLEFIFAPRILKWNVAFASVLILIIGTAVFFFNKNGYHENDIVNVRFELAMPASNGIKTVSLAGDFNGWDVENMKLQPVKDGLWEIEVPLKKGRYQYMFVINGKKWMHDPKANKVINDGFGGKNSLLEI